MDVCGDVTALSLFTIGEAECALLSEVGGSGDVTFLVLDPHLRRLSLRVCGEGAVPAAADLEAGGGGSEQPTKMAGVQLRAPATAEPAAGGSRRISFDCVQILRSQDLLINGKPHAPKPASAVTLSVRAFDDV